MWRLDCRDGGALRRQIAFRKPVFLLLLCLGLAACGVTRGQLDAVGAFGKSANKLADSIKDAYAQADKNEVDIRLAREIVSVRFSDPDAIWKDIKQRRFDLSNSKIKGRLAAAEALSAYGVALASLLDSKTQDSDFSTAATSLAGAIKGLPESALKDAGITTSDVEGIGAVVVALGKIALDIRRREVLEEIVPAAEPTVTKICRLFERDFDVEKGYVGGFVNSEMAKSLDDIERVFKPDGPGRPPLRAADTGASMQNRAVLIPLYENLSGIRARTLATFKALKEAARSCATASVKLADAVRNPEATIDDIIDFVKNAKAAFDAVRNLTASNKGN